MMSRGVRTALSLVSWRPGDLSTANLVVVNSEISGHTRYARLVSFAEIDCYLYRHLKRFPLSMMMDEK